MDIKIKDPNILFKTVPILWYDPGTVTPVSADLLVLVVVLNAERTLTPSTVFHLCLNNKTLWVVYSMLLQICIMYIEKHILLSVMDPHCFAQRQFNKLDVCYYDPLVSWAYSWRTVSQLRKSPSVPFMFLFTHRVNYNDFTLLWKKKSKPNAKVLYQYKRSFLYLLKAAGL